MMKIQVNKKCTSNFRKTIYSYYSKTELQTHMFICFIKMYQLKNCIMLKLSHVSSIIFYMDIKHILFSSKRSIVICQFQNLNKANFTIQCVILIEQPFSGSSISYWAAEIQNKIYPNKKVCLMLSFDGFICVDDLLNHTAFPNSVTLSLISSSWISSSPFHLLSVMSLKKCFCFFNSTKFNQGFLQDPGWGN